MALRSFLDETPYASWRAPGLREVEGFRSKELGGP